MPTSCCRHLVCSEDDERLVPTAVGTRLGTLRRLERGAPPRRGNKDQKWLVFTGCQQSFKSEHDRLLVSLGCPHSLWSEIDERLVPQLLALVQAACAVGGSKDHKWLVHTGCQNSFGNEDDKRLVPTSCLLRFWSEARRGTPFWGEK